MSKPFINTAYDGHKHLRVPNTNTYNSFCARCGHILSEFSSSEIEELNLTMKDIRAMNGWEEPDLRGAIDKAIAQNDGSNVFTSDSPFSKKEEPWQYGQEYDPTGEPDIISEDDQKLLDFFNSVEKGDESYASEEDVFTWISTKLGLKPRKQTTYGPKEIPDNRPKERPTLCRPSEIYDHKSGKCIPKYMAPWRLRNESYASETHIDGRYEIRDSHDEVMGTRFDSLDLAKWTAKKLNEHQQIKIVDTNGNKTVWVGESYAKEDNPTEEELGFSECPECNKMFYDWKLKEHMQQEHSNNVDDYSFDKLGNIYDPNVWDLSESYAKEGKSECMDCKRAGKSFVVDDYDPGNKTQKHVQWHKQKEGNDYEPDFTGIKNEASNPKMGNLGRIEDIYRDMLSQMDPQDTGDIASTYYSDVIGEMAQKYNLSEYQIQEIWDSGGTTDIDVSNEEYSSENEGELTDKIFGDSMLPGADWLTKKITGEEEIIEKTPPKIEYMYYKQYPLGRRANVKNHYGKEVSIERLREVEKWWGQVRAKQGYPTWKEMNIINRQRAIIDFLNNAPIADLPLQEAYAREYYPNKVWECSHDDTEDQTGRGDIYCKLCGASQSEMNDYVDMNNDAREGKLQPFSYYDVERDGYEYVKDNWDFSKEVKANEGEYDYMDHFTYQYSQIFQGNNSGQYIHGIKCKICGAYINNNHGYDDPKQPMKSHLLQHDMSYEAKEPYGARDEYEALKNVDTTGMSEEEIDGYYERLNELRITLGESYNSITNILNEADFKEEEHPRDPDGEFTSGGGSSGGKKEPSKAQKDHTQALKNHDEDMKKYDEKMKEHNDKMKEYKEKVKWASQMKKKFNKTDEIYMEGIQGGQQSSDGIDGIVKHMNDRKYGFASKKVTFSDVSRAISKFQKMELMGQSKNRNDRGFVTNTHYWASTGYSIMKHGPTQPKEPEKPTKPVKRKEEISQTKNDQLNRLVNRYGKSKGSKRKEYEGQLHTKLDALNKNRDFVKDGHYIVDTDYNRELKRETGVVKLMQPHKSSLTYPNKPTHDGYSSDYTPHDFEVGGDMVKVGDTIEFNDSRNDAGRTQVIVSSFDYGGDEWEGPSINGYVTSSTNTDEETGHPRYKPKGHGDHRVSDATRIVSSSKTKMKSRESKQSDYNKVRNLMDMREAPEHGDDLDRWASEWNVSEELVEEVWEKEFGGKFEEDYANEGGRGSGKRGHAGWMKSLEEASDYKDCPNCQVMTDQYGGKCQLCGKKV